jgi:hypothetical protein
MNRFTLFTFAFVLVYSFASFAVPDRNVFIPQIPPQSRLNETMLKREVFDTKSMQDQPPTQDYQSQIMNNPVISDFGRANSFIQIVATEPASVVNKALIYEEESGDAAVIAKKNNKNKLLNKKKAGHNEMRSDQQGDHNSSKESQTGKHNRKYKVQSNKSGKFNIEQ